MNPRAPTRANNKLWLMPIAALVVGCGSGTDTSGVVGNASGGGGFVIGDSGIATSSGGTDAGLTNDATTPQDTGTQPTDTVLGDSSGGQQDSGIAQDAGKVGPVCTSAAACSGLTDTPYCDKPNSVCVQCLIDNHCEMAGLKGHSCTKNHKCVPTSCQAKAQQCNASTGFLEVCNDTGTGYDVKVCPELAPVCVVDKCRKCKPDTKFCGKPNVPGQPSLYLMQCNADGSNDSIAQTCKTGEICVNGACTTCVPGIKECQGNKAVACNDKGDGYTLVADCDKGGLACLAGTCVNPCSSDLKSNTNVGCDYYAVDLDNALITAPGGQVYDAQNAQFSLIIGNTKKAAAVVTVTASTGHAAKYAIPAEKTRVINLPDPLWKLPPMNQDGSSINLNSFRIQSNQPIVAYQFNPLQNFDVFSNDASLLLPSNALGKEYWVMTREQSHDAFRGYFTIVAINSGVTNVEVLPKGEVLAGGGMGQSIPGGLWPGLKKFQLTKGQVLNIESGKNGVDFTGSYIKADRAIAVFAGSEASNAPATNKCVVVQGKGTCAFQGWTCSKDADCPVTCCSDHLEEQLLPVDNWGTEYAATRTWPRGQAKDVWRIMASQNGTVVTTIPPQTVVPTLNQGEWHEFESASDFIIKANKPIFVGQFLAGSMAPKPNNDICDTKYGFQQICTGYKQQFKTNISCKKNSDCPNLPEAGDAGIGDPAFIMAVATNRFLPEYTFLVPGNYAKSYVNIVSPPGNKVLLDGVQIPPQQFVGFGTGQFQVLRLSVLPGSHSIKADKAVGLVVYGWDKDVSYGYPGGLAVGGGS